MRIISVLFNKENLRENESTSRVTLLGYKTRKYCVVKSQDRPYFVHTKYVNLFGRFDFYNICSNIYFHFLKTKTIDKL